MRQVSICNPLMERFTVNGYRLQPLNLYGREMLCGMINTGKPVPFDPSSDAHSHSVLVKKKGFSCNFRDQALALLGHSKIAHLALRNIAKHFPVGSEFSGEVVAVGHHVKQFSPGDRVMSDNCYVNNNDGVRLGVSSNHSSRELEVIHASKLIGIPTDMDDATAACFSLNAQTVYAMIRKLNLHPDDNVLITGGTSNVALFSIQALANAGVNIYAVTTRTTFQDQLSKMGVREVFVVDPDKPFLQHERLKEVATKLQGFQAVIDPFFDTYLEKAVEVMAFGAKYITCGFVQQHELQKPEKNGASAGTFQKMDKIMTRVMLANQVLIGNCIGTTADLERAIQDWEEGKFRIPVDSVYSDGQIKAFFDRTFNSKDRFGKVAFVYQ